MIRAVFTLLVTALLSLVLGTTALLNALFPRRQRRFVGLLNLWARGVLWSAAVRIRVADQQRVVGGRPAFLAGNHQSAIDIPVLIAVTRGRSLFMAKKSLFSIPVFGWVMRLYGFVPVDRSSPRNAKSAIDAALARIRRDPRTLVVFPEGTRSPDGHIAEFKRGAINVAQQSGMPIVPFAIDGSLRIHRRGVFKVTPGEVRVAVGDAISPEHAAKLSTVELSRRVRTTVLALHQQIRVAEAVPEPCPAAGNGVGG